MNDQLISSDNIDDDRTQNHELSPSIISDDNCEIPLESIRSLLSNEDIQICHYVTNINWFEKFSIHLSNNQHQRRYSNSSQENICKYRIDQLNYSEKSLLNSSKYIDERFIELEYSILLPLTSNYQKRQSSTNNSEQQLCSSVNNQYKSFHSPIIFSSKNNSLSKIKLRRVNSYPQLSFHQIKDMSSTQILPIHIQSSSSSRHETRRHSLTTLNNSNIPKSREKQMTFQFKTKQEDIICGTNKSSSAITCSTITNLSSPHRVQIHPPRRSSISNNCLRSIRVSVSSSPYENEFIQRIETESPTYSSIISNFVQQNLNEQTKSNETEEETFNYRPLLDLINKLNQQDKTVSSLSVSSPKQLSTFQPTIIHKKYQIPIDHFDSIDNNEDSSPSFTRRNGVMRSHTFTTPTDVNSTSNQISSDDTITCQSTSQLISLNQLVESPILKPIHNSPLSTSATSLTNTSIINATPTSSGSIDDKNEAKRKAIALQMYDTEKSYVEALKNLVTKYYLPMKDKNIVSNDLTNDIFYKIPEIHIHHTAFLISLSQKLSQWDNKQTVGDLLLQMFTRTSVIETYTSFVNNYKTAQLAIRLCRDFSSFNKFLEQQARDHRGKLTLRDLIIQPVQRIPRYELYLKDFLKCTNINHPDYQLLLKAQLEIHSLAEQIDRVQEEVGSTELTLANNSLELVQDMIENLTDLVNIDRYYICHDVVTLQSSTGLKKDRCIFLFNDLFIITSCKRRTGTLTKKSNNSFVVNSPSGKQYIDNAKHKLIMKISLESVDLAADHLKKKRLSVSTPPSLKKSHSTASTTTDKHRHFEEDVLILGQMSDLAKTITAPHQQLDDSIKETLTTVNKHLLDETINLRRTSPEPNIIFDNIQQKSNNIQLIIHTTECTETIDAIFSSSEQKLIWEKNFLEAKKILLEIATGRRNISFQHVLTLPHNRSGSQFCCGTARSCSDDFCLCNTEGELCLINIESDVRVKSSNRITSSGINCIAYIPTNKIHGKSISIKHKRDFILKQELNNSESILSIDSLLDIDSSDDEEINHEDQFSLNTYDEHLNNEQQNVKEPTIWLGTQNGELFIYECSQTIERKGRIVKQLNSSIHSILYIDNKVFLALNHGQLCVFKRDFSGRWDLDFPIIRSIEENDRTSNDKNGEFYDKENTDPISVMTLAAGRLWCAIQDKIFVVCPNSLNVQHSFVVDDCHRHVCSMVAGGSSVHHVWIASQGSHEIRLYHATHFVCLLETSIRTAVTQKLQVCDDIIRAHKLGCLCISTLYVCKETLWIGTSAGIIINLTIPQLIDSISISGTNKLTSNSIQLKGLTFGHAGPVRFIISTDKNILSTTDDGSTVKTFVITCGDGFEDYNNNDENLGKDDALSHLILWQL